MSFKSVSSVLCIFIFLSFGIFYVSAHEMSKDMSIQGSSSQNKGKFLDIPTGGRGIDTFDYAVTSGWSDCGYGVRFRFNILGDSGIEVENDKCPGSPPFYQDGVLKLFVYNPGTNSWLEYGFGAQVAYSAGDTSVGDFVIDPINERGGTTRHQHYRVQVGADSTLPTGEREAWVNFYLPQSTPVYNFYEYDVSTPDLVCGDIIALQITPVDEGLLFRAQACAGNPFLRDGEFVVYINGNPYGYSVQYNAGDGPSIYFTLDPASQGYSQPNVWNDFFIKGGEEGNLESGHIQAQYTEQQDFSISGKVVTNQNQGIANVKLTLNTGAVAYTDGNGDYEFLDLPLGSYYWVAELTGYTFNPYVLGGTVGPNLTATDIEGTEINQNIVLPVGYVDQVFVQETPNNDGYWSYCGPSSLAMLLHYLNLLNGDILNDPQLTENLVCETMPNCKTKPYSVPAMIETALQNRALATEMRWNRSVTYDMITNSIDQGFPVIFSLEQENHIFVITGYGPNNTVIVNDPYGDFRWWDFTYPINRNAPYEGFPKQLGRGVSYEYLNDITPFYAIFIEGGRPNLSPVVSRIENDGGTVKNIHDGFLATFPTNNQGGLNVLYNYSPDSITTPIDVSNDSSEDIVFTFELTAENFSGATITSFDQNYSITLDLEPYLFENWANTYGATPAGVSNEDLLNWHYQPAVYRWNYYNNIWEPISYQYNPNTGDLSILQSQFSQFKIVVEQIKQTYLPIIIK